MKLLAGLLPPAWRAQRSVGVAFSGGPDSTALLLAARDAGCRPVALHVDHGLRPESVREAAWLAARCRAWDVPFVVRRVPVAQHGNLEARARRARYAVLAEMAREKGLSRIWLAHHADDQAETVCLRMLMGAGPRGAAGMRPRRAWAGILWERPFLALRRAEIRKALAAAGVRALHDPMNEDLRFRRNFVRLRLFPAMAAKGCDPVALFLRWGKAAEQMQARIDEAACLDAVRAHPEGACIPWETWCRDGMALRAARLQRMVAMALGEGRTPGRRHIELAERWTQQGGHGGLDLSRARLERRGPMLVLARRASWRIHEQAPMLVGQCKSDEVDVCAT